MSITPINSAEAITDPFWDSSFNTLDRWRISSGAGHGLQVWQNWCWVAFEWRQAPPDGPALRMTRRCDLDCSAYDTLMVSARLPRTCVLTVVAQTDSGPRSAEMTPHQDGRKEYCLPLDGAATVQEIRLELATTAHGPAAGWLNWVGLRNTPAMARYHARWPADASRWDRHIQPAGCFTQNL